MKLDVFKYVDISTISEEGINFVKNSILADPKERLDIQGMLNHHWLKDITLQLIQEEEKSVQKKSFLSVDQNKAGTLTASKSGKKFFDPKSITINQNPVKFSDNKIVNEIINEKQFQNSQLTLKYPSKSIPVPISEKSRSERNLMKNDQGNKPSPAKVSTFNMGKN